jgi:hypothetical protein
MTEPCSVLLNQIVLLLQQISPEDYKQKLRILNGSSIGQHVRHTLEFYLCLVDQHELGFINYDLRARDIQLESEPCSALEKITSIKEALTGITSNRNIYLIMSGDNDSIKAPSSIERELIYVNEHAVHHMAIIKSGLLEINGNIKLPESFGIAPSTLRFRKKIGSIPG